MGSLAVSGGGESAGPPVEPTELLLDDFADGDAFLEAPGFRGTWSTYSDGTGQVDPPEGVPAAPVAGALVVSGSGFSDWGVGVGVGFDDTGGPRGEVDLGSYSGLSVRVRGRGLVALELVTTATTGTAEGGACAGEGCFGHFSVPVTLAAEPEELRLPFSAFSQPEWAQAAALDLARVIGINFLVRSEGGVADIELGVERLALFRDPPAVTPVASGGEGAAQSGSPGPVVPVAEGANPFAGRSLHTGARQALAAYDAAAGAERELLGKVALNPTAFWLNGGDPARAGAIVDGGGGNYAVLVAYNIPDRDCGNESAGGAGSADEYRGWIDAMSRSLQGKQAAVVLEPDALALGCEGEVDQLIAYAVRSLRQNPGVAVYIDGAHSNWHPAAVMAERLRRAGIEEATGFAVNVSNFEPTNALIDYGTQLSALVGGKPFIIDTSRNGQGGRGGEWCNPAGAGLGEAPTTDTGNPLVHALLWVKRPGESDGACGQCAGVSAGQFCTRYALELARNAAF